MLSNEFLLDNEMLWSSPPPIDLRLLLGDLTANPLLPIVLDSVDEELLLLVGLGLRRLRRRLVLVVVGGGGTTSDDEHIIMGRR
jgi:hypothetical protein